MNKKKSETSPARSERAGRFHMRKKTPAEKTQKQEKQENADISADQIKTADDKTADTKAADAKTAGKKATDAKTAARRRRRDRAVTVLLICVFLIGIGVLLYPTVSNWWNRRVTTRAIANYDAAVAQMSEADYTELLEAAAEYNEMLAGIGSSVTITNPDLVDEDYWDLLDISGTGIIGYITIEKIDVQLPIYHGTDAGVLQVGAGHLEGTSLPTGGETTHAVISAHRGLPSALLFTNLDQMEEGDTFTITVLDQVLTYEVDQISVVLPEEIENLYIEEGKDYCTLMTCTPYGVNSHRLLVRGVRIENAAESLIHVTAEAYQIDTIIVASIVAVPLLLILLICLLVSTRRKRNK